MDKKKGLLALLSVVAGCSSDPVQVGNGQLVVTLPLELSPRGLVVTDQVRILTQDSMDQKEVSLVERGVVTKEPVDTSSVTYNHFDFSGGTFTYAFQVIGRDAFFVGSAGVTRAPLTGGPSTLLSTKNDTGTSFLSLRGGAGIDGSDVYACIPHFYDGKLWNSALVRLGAGVAPTVLARFSPQEDCQFTSVHVDSEAVYLATSKALYRWAKTDGQVVKLNTGSASERLRMLLDFTSDESSLYLFGSNVIKVDKKGGPPLQLIPDVQGFDPAVETVILDKKYVYLNDQGEIRRVPISGGRIEVLAKRSGSLQTNKFIGLAQDATKLYFFELYGDKPATLRSVPK
jgi:hypothetical protein